MNKIINYLLALRVALVNRTALGVEQAYYLSLDNEESFRGGEFKDPCGWDVRNYSLSIENYRNEVICFSVFRYWVCFQMPQFFKEFIKIARNCDLLDREEDEVLWKVFKTPQTCYNVLSEEPKSSKSVYFTPGKGIYFPEESRKIYLEIPTYQGDTLSDERQIEMEDAIQVAFNKLEEDLKDVFGKVIMLFEQFHKEKFLKHYAMKPYFVLEEAFIRDFVAGKRLWGQKADKMAADMSEIVKIPHFLAIGDIYSGSFDLMRVESTSSWD